MGPPFSALTVQYFKPITVLHLFTESDSVTT